MNNSGSQIPENPAQNLADSHLAAPSDSPQISSASASAPPSVFRTNSPTPSGPQSPILLIDSLTIGSSRVNTAPVMSLESAPGSFSLLSNSSGDKSPNLKEILGQFDPLKSRGGSEEADELRNATLPSPSLPIRAETTGDEITAPQSTADNLKGQERPERKQNEAQQKENTAPLIAELLAESTPSLPPPSETSDPPAEIGSSSVAGNSGNTETVAPSATISAISASASASASAASDSETASATPLPRSKQQKTRKLRLKKSTGASDTPPFDFQKFLGQLKQKSAEPIARYLKSFLTEFSKGSWTAEEQSKLVADFRQFITPRMSQVPPFSSMTPAEFENAKEGMEKLIMNRLYHQTFPPVIPLEKRHSSHNQDLAEDEQLDDQFARWEWITGPHLDLSEPFMESGSAFLSLAEEELSKINKFRAPRDKVICLLNCCKVIFGLLRQSKSEENADSFIPILIFVVLKARPPHLVSNLNYIQRFRSPEKLGGEAGYYLSSLQGAVGFIQTLSPDSLTVTPEEYAEKSRKAEEALVARKEAQRREKEKEKEKEKESETRRLFAPIGIPLRPFSPFGGDSGDHKTDRRNDGDNGGNHESTKTDEEGDKEISRALSPSTVLLTSAGMLAEQLKTFGTKLFDAEGPKAESAGQEGQEGPSGSAEPSEAPRYPSRLQKATELSLKEHSIEQQRRKQHEACGATLAQMFPGLDREVIDDIVALKQADLDACVDACLALTEE